MADRTHTVSYGDGGLAFFCSVSRSSPLRVLPSLGFRPVRVDQVSSHRRPRPQPLSLNPLCQVDGALSGFPQRPCRQRTQHQPGHLRLETSTPPSPHSLSPRGWGGLHPPSRAILGTQSWREQLPMLRRSPPRGSFSQAVGPRALCPAPPREAGRPFSVLSSAPAWCGPRSFIPLAENRRPRPF